MRIINNDKIIYLLILLLGIPIFILFGNSFSRGLIILFIFYVAMVFLSAYTSKYIHKIIDKKQSKKVGLRAIIIAIIILVAAWIMFANYMNVL